MQGDGCPICGTELIDFSELSGPERERVEADPDRQRQSLSHRREKHTVCPSCTLEIHGCGQPYALPEGVAAGSGQSST